MMGEQGVFSSCHPSEITEHEAKLREDNCVKKKFKKNHRFFCKLRNEEKKNED